MYQSVVSLLAGRVRESRGLAHKRDISGVLSLLGGASGDATPIGDDCAAIPDGDGFLLLAIEGFLPEFVASLPWFAGYSGVMVNLSDIAAMGGRPIAVVDALWSRDAAHAAPLLKGLADAARAYGVPLVGGHSNTRSTAGEQLAVAVLGRARHLLSSFAARPGDILVAAIDLRGAWHDPHPFWDASSGAARAGQGARLRADLDILPAIAEAGLSRAAKDISMAGLPGTALMLAECSGIGMSLDLAAIPRPPGTDLARWLAAFPSYGYLLTATPHDVPALLAHFTGRGIAAAAIGICEAGTRLDFIEDGQRETCWNLADEPLMGCGP